MRSEELDSFVKLQQLVPGEDASGQPNTAWVTVCPVWASILDLSGNQFINSGATKNSVVSSIKIRFDERVKADMRIQSGDDYYDIESILLSKDKRWQTLMCKKGLSNG